MSVGQSIYFNNKAGWHLGFARISLTLILFAAISQFASFALIQVHVISFYGAQPEDISFAFQIAFAGIITILPIQFRLVRYFNTRNYLLTALLTGILLNIGCMFVHDLFLFCILRFLVGVTTCIVAGCMLIVIFSTLPESKKILVGISLFFSLVLTCGLIVGIGAARVVQRMDWTAVYYSLIGLQVIAMLLCILIFKPVPAVKPYPLYQIDWAGCVLFMFGAAAISFVMIYAPKRYWFEDTLIRQTAIFSVVTIALFFFRQTTLKRPLIDLRVFNSGKFIFAIFLMLLFYATRDSINLLYSYASSVLGWNTKEVTHAGLFNIAGVIAATIIALKIILAKKQSVPLLILAGFAVMFFYHTWVYINLTPDLSIHELRIPIFLQGFASGLLLVPITIFCISAVPGGTGMTGIVICAYARFIAVHCSIAGFYTLQLDYNQKYKESFLAKLIPENDILLQRQDLYKELFMSKGYYPGDASTVSNIFIAKSSDVQSLLLAIRTIFLIAAVLMAFAFMALLVFAIVNKLQSARIKTVTTVTP